MTVALVWQEEGPVGAPVVVLLNAIGATTAMWDPQVGALADRFYVIRVDARGHGRSPASTAGEACTVADLGRDVLAALDRAGVSRANIAGLSLGGMVAIWLAAHHPERVGRLALLCTSAHLPPVERWLERAAFVRADGMEAIADSVVERWVTPGFAARDPEAIARLRSMLVSVDAESYAQCCEAIAALDLRPDLSRITAPTLVIAAAEDVATPPEHAYALAAGIAGARVEVVSPGAHLATIEQAGATAGLLLEHFGARDSLAMGFRTRRLVLGDEHVDRAVAGATEFTAAFQEFITRYAWGDVWARPGLPLRERSLITLAALVVLGAEHEIALHVRAARRNGLTRAEISEALLHAAVYAGLPRANRAFAIAQQVLDEEGVGD